MKSRCIHLMRLLVEAEDVLTIQEMANRLNVSKKTIRNDLGDCNAYLRDLKIDLVKKSGVGVFIVADASARLRALNALNQETVGRMGYGALQRQLYILKKLLLGKQKISFAWLEANLYVSKPSIYKDINAVEVWLAETDIALAKDKYGRYTLDGGEKRVRKAIFDWRAACLNALSAHDAEDMMRDTPFSRAYEKKRSSEIVHHIETTFGIRLAPEDFKSMVTKMTIITDRIYDSHYVTLKKETLAHLSTLRLYKHIESIALFVQKTYHIILTDAEKCYLLGLIIALNICEGPSDWNIDKSYIEINDALCRQIVSVIKTNLHILKDDATAIYDEVLPCVQRFTNQILYGLYSHHTIADAITRHYTLIPEIVRHISLLFEHTFHYTFTLSDTSEWIVLIAELIEKSKQPLRGAFIYSFTQHDANLVLQALKNNLAQLEVCEVVPYDAHRLHNLSSYDVIFIDAHYDDVFDAYTTVLVISPILTHVDILTLFEKIAKLYETKNYQHIRKAYISSPDEI